MGCFPKFESIGKLMTEIKCRCGRNCCNNTTNVNNYYSQEPEIEHTYSEEQMFELSIKDKKKIIV